MADPESQQIDRRTFVKTTAGAAAAAGGIEGILAARRAPAFAQGTKLHGVRCVDFVPESDVELKRQMPEACKALGAEVTLETINANDLQARITAAIQSGSGADIFLMQYDWPQLYANALVDVSDVANDLAKAEGGFYDIYPPSCNVNGKWLVPHPGGLWRGRHEGVGEPRDVGEGGRPAEDVPHRRPQHAPVRLRGTLHRQGHRGLLEVHHHRHVCQGRPGHEGGGRGALGRRGAEEDLRKLSP